MLRETGLTPRCDPSVCEPESRKTQGISHVLASTFKDLYTKGIGTDSASAIIKTSSKQRITNSYHDKVVRDLQQAHAEYIQCIKEADMLESHIIQGRARAAETESQAYERMREEMRESSDQQSFLTDQSWATGSPGATCSPPAPSIWPSIKSAFSWCVDNGLLEMNNLISPQDYLPKEKLHVKAPPAIKSNPARATVAYTMYISRKLQDDGYSPISGQEKAVQEITEPYITLMESSVDSPKSNTSKEKPNQTKPKPKWRGKPSAKDREEGLEKLQRLKEQRSFLCNPRFLPVSSQQGGMSLIRPWTKPGKKEQMGKRTEEHRLTEDPVPVFLAKPPKIIFTGYSVGQVYETTLELKNLTSASRHIRLIPPTTPYFSIGLGRFPGDGGIVAPGMSCKYTVRFAPDSLGDYVDFIVVETQAEHLLVVPVAARRPPPVLTLPRILDCGYCLVGGVTFVEFICQNVGFSSGTFCIIPKNQWPASNLRSVERNFFSEQPPFAISPSLFVLQPGEATLVEVVFFPTLAEKSCQDFTIICDNCQVKDISIKGEGQLVALDLVSVSGQNEPSVLGEVRDLTAEHLVRFSPCNPHSVQEKKLIIRNNVHLELPYHWQIVKPNLHPLLPGETPEPSHIQFHLATDDVFKVSPMMGVLSPCQEEEFVVTFTPKELKDYHSVCHLVLRDVPELPPDPSEDSVLQPVRTGSKMCDIIVMEIEVKGSTEPYQVLLDPYAVIIPGEIFICTTIHRKFKMWNHSKTCIFFHWERMNSSTHIIEVEPSSGSIEENECFDFDLIVTGGKPEKVVTSLVCNIKHCHKPVILAVEVSFKGPAVTPSVPSVDFGLMRLGEQKNITLLLTNITQLEANWTLKERQNSQQDSQVLVDPCSGVLSPLASCRVNVLFMSRFCQQYYSELELITENGTGCHLSVRADVQSPQVRLLSCELLLSGLYVGVPANATVTLFNQTLLPTDFSWKPQLQGKQADFCTATFQPFSGTLGPIARMDITVTFTSNTDAELTEIAALCEIQGMKCPLVLSIVVSKTKKLSVSYSLSCVSSTQDDENPSKLLLNFGGDVVLKKAVTKQLRITNQTAIIAPFSVEVEYFTCHVKKPDNQSGKRFSYVKKPLHSVQAKKLEEKAHEEFVSSLLANGKGAAFFVQPHCGMLGAFESQTVDVTAYTDIWGGYKDNLICKVGDLEATLIPMQMTVRGCPLYFQMTGPRPDSQTQGPTIHFGSHVSGGDTVSRSLRINNTSMFDICIDWETYNIDENGCKLVAFGETFPAAKAEGDEVSSEELPDSDEIQTVEDRSLTSVQHSTVSPLNNTAQNFQLVDERSQDETSTPIRSRTVSPCNNTAQNIQLVDEKSQDETSTPILSRTEEEIVGHKCKNSSEEEETCNLSDYPFCITPQQTIIPAKGSGTIHVSFTPLTLSGAVRESRCVGLAFGFLSLDSEMAVCVPGKVTRAQGLDLEAVRMDLQATVKPARLLVQLEEDGGVLEFRASVGDLLRPGGSEEELIVREFDTTQTFQLKNNSEMTLHFKLGTQLPFSVLKPHPRAVTSTPSNPPTGDSHCLELKPQQSMQVKVAFHCTLSLLDQSKQVEEDVQVGTTLITSDSGKRKLRFQQNLLIHYSNNTLQTVPLCAHLDLAAMHLSTDTVDFGFCYVGQTQTVEVNLHNQGAHTYWKSALESDVFRVTPASGILRSKEPRISSSQRLQISFTPSEIREFRSTLVIQSPLVRAPLTLQLRGTGSFDEGHKSSQTL